MGYGLKPSRRARTRLIGKKVGSAILDVKNTYEATTKKSSTSANTKAMARLSFNHTCFIVGGGASLTGFDFSRLANVTTIVVNYSIFDVPNADYFITKDYSFLHKVGILGTKINQEMLDSFMNAKAEKIFVAGYPGGVVRDKDGRIYDTKLNDFYNTDIFDSVIKSYRIDGVGLSFNDFRCGGESGYCALQLAVMLRFRTIYLLGIDLRVNVKSHYHSAYRWRDAEKYYKRTESWLNTYTKGIDEIKNKTQSTVFSCSPVSRLNKIIPYVPLESIL